MMIVWVILFKNYMAELKSLSCSWQLYCYVILMHHLIAAIVVSDFPFLALPFLRTIFTTLVFPPYVLVMLCSIKFAFLLQHGVFQFNYTLQGRLYIIVTSTTRSCSNRHCFCNEKQSHLRPIAWYASVKVCAAYLHFKLPTPLPTTICKAHLNFIFCMFVISQHLVLVLLYFATIKFSVHNATRSKFQN